MRNIFCDANVPLNDLINDVVPVSQALSDEQIIPSINAAWDNFIVPILGKACADELLDAIKSEDDNKLEAVRIARIATANLAFFFNFTELSVHITDQGFQRQEGDTFKPLYRYQEIDLKGSFRNKGFNAIERLIDFLFEHAELFSHFKESAVFVARSKAVVKSPDEIERLVFINRSYLIYMTLVSRFNRIMDVKLEPVIGPKAMELLRNYLSGGIDADSSDAILAEKLRMKVVPVVVLQALAEHVTTVGEISDRGLFYSQTAAASHESQENKPARDADRLRLRAQFMEDAHHYEHVLLRFIRTEMPDKYAGLPCDALNRDNNNHNTFWA